MSINNIGKKIERKVKSTFNSFKSKIIKSNDFVFIFIIIVLVDYQLTNL